MTVDAYNSSSSKNPMMFFGKFEWINLYCILVQFGDLYCNHIFPCSNDPELFFLLVALPTKLLSPGDWAHWRFWSACSKPLFFLPKTGVLQNLHYQLSVFAKLIPPPSPVSKETLIWRLWPLQELPKCTWHSVEHLGCTVSFGKLSGLHCGLEPLAYLPCPQSA